MMTNETGKRDPRRKKTWLRVISLVLVFALLSSVVVTQFDSISSFLGGIAEGDPLSRIYSILQGEIDQPETYDDYYQLATIAIGRGEYEVAMGHLDTCLELADEQDTAQMADLWFKIGSVYMLMEAEDDALKSFDKVLEYDETYAQALIFRAQIYINRQNYPDAAADLEAYLTYVPEEISVYSTLAQIREALGEYAAARDCYARMYEMDPEEDLYLLNSLRCSLQAGEYDEAIAGFDAYLSENAEQTEVENAPGASAEPVEQESASSEPTEQEALRASAYFLRGASKMQIALFDEAVSDYRAAVALGYDVASCYEQMVACYFSMEDYESAASAGKELLAMNVAPAAGDAFYQRMGVAAMQLENYEEAVELLTKSVELNPDLNGNYYYRGVCLMALEKQQEAIDDLTKSIEQEFLTQFCYYNRGVCYVQLLDYESALDDMEKTLSAGDDASLKDAATNILWQLAQYYENQAAVQTEVEPILEDVESIPEATE